MTALTHGLGAALRGEAPCATARIDAAPYARPRPTAAGLTSHAIAAIENACLDIRGKALGVPVYELLGGAVRERLPVYWSRCGVLRARCAELFDGKVIDRPAVRSLDDLKAAAREARERGFKALKTNVLLFDAKGGRQFAPGMIGAGAGHPELNLAENLLDALIAQLAALREGAGRGVRLLLDLNFNYKPEGLRRIAQRPARQYHERAFLRGDPQLPHHGVRRRRGAVESQAPHQALHDRERRIPPPHRPRLGHGRQ